MVRAFVFQPYYARGAIHVTLHKMATETAVGREGALEVDVASRAQRPEICAVESLFQEVEGKLFAALGRDRQAAAIDRNTVSNLDFLCDTRCDDLKLRASSSRVDPEEAADFFNETGKHELVVHRLTQIRAGFLWEPSPIFN
jgi:hypothetical protein